MLHLNPRLVLCSLVLLGGCDPSDFKAWVEGNRDIPAEWDFIPERAREDLIDADIEEGKVSLRYHEGEWSSIVAAFEESLAKDGYTHVGSCPLSGSDDVGSVSYAKLSGDGKADVIMVGLSVLLKGSGHFFIDVRRADFTRMIIPEGCTLSAEAGTVCEDPSNGCAFKAAAN